jgi:hypothetical protein
VPPVMARGAPCSVCRGLVPQGNGGLCSKCAILRACYCGPEPWETIEDNLREHRRCFHCLGWLVAADTARGGHTVAYAGAYHRKCFREHVRGR